MEDIKYKICIWTPIPSPHQKYFFEALAKHPSIDLVVSYYENFPRERIELGWGNESSEIFVENFDYMNPELALANIADWRARIHIIPGISSAYMKSIHKLLMANECRWIHWSERCGLILAEKLGYNRYLFYCLFFIYRIKYFLYAKQINKSALGVFAIGDAAKKDFIKWGVEDRKIEYLFYTIRHAEATKEVDIFSDCKVFVFAGSLIKRKGVESLLYAFANLRNSREWRLLLIGSGDKRQIYLDLCKRLGIEDRTLFLGSVPIADVRSYLKRADVFILPTLFDGWGAVLNEAASVSKPLISTDECGAAFHLIQDKVNGFIVKAGDSKELTRAMQYYVDNPEVVCEHGFRSYEIYLNYTPDKNVDRFIAALNKWLN